MNPATYKINIDKATEAIRRFNESPMLSASEHLMNLHFGSVEEALDAETMAVRVSLIDGLWATQLFMQPGAATDIAANLASHSKRLIERIADLSEDALVGSPDRVIEVSREILPVVLTPPVTNGRKPKKNYSFATKFFHWTTRRHFPIVDSRARKSIRKLQSDLKIPREKQVDPPTGDGLSYVDNYERWIWFYSDLINSFSVNQRNELIKANEDSTPRAYRTATTMLRILDKVFYVQGGEKLPS